MFLLADVIGQNAAVLKARGFVERFEPGKALMLYGPPGTGKTMIVRALANEYGLELVELNASDRRSEKAIEESVGRAMHQRSLSEKGKLILIDELESFDRGTVPAVVSIIKESTFPVIITARNPYVQKLLPLRNLCELAEVKKLTSVAVEKHLKKLGCKNAAEVAKAANGDLRAAMIDADACGNARELQESVFTTVRTLFRGNLETARKAVDASEATPEELFWWLENNIMNEFKKGTEIAEAFDLLSRIDVARRRGRTDGMIAAFSTIHRRPDFTFVSYKPPRPFFGRKSVVEGIHCSQKKIRGDPSLRSLVG